MAEKHRQFFHVSKEEVKNSKCRETTKTKQKIRTHLSIEYERNIIQNFIKKTNDERRKSYDERKT